MAIAITPVLTAANTTAPADGFCLFFWDSQYKLIPKGYADSLGYTNYYGVLGNETFALSGAYNGIRGAWLGVGFDLKGDFGTISNYKTGALSAWDGNALSAREGLSQPINNSVTVRSGEDFKWSVITRTPNLSTFDSPVTFHQVITSIDDIEYKRCRVRLQNNGTLLKVEIKDTNGEYQTYIEQTLEPTGTPANAVYNSVPSIPDTLNVGLTFSSGETTSNCWIKNFSVYGDTVTNENASTILDSLTGLTVVHPTSAG